MPSFYFILREKTPLAIARETFIGNVEILSKTDSDYDHISVALIGQYIVKNNKFSPPQQINSIFYNKKIRLSENNTFKAFWS